MNAHPHPRTVIRTAVAVTILALLTTLTGPTPAAAHTSTRPSTGGDTAAWGQPCSKLFVVGVRGSGAAWDANEGFGTLPKRVIDTARRRGGRITAAALPYEAVDIGVVAASATFRNDPSMYVASQTNGTRMLNLLIGQRMRKCPTEKYFFVGHSQGAHVISDWFRYWPNATVKSRIAGAALFADPSFNPTQTGVAGTYRRDLAGIFSSPVRWSGINGVASFCTGGDPVCQWSPRNLPTIARHTNGYSPEETATAAHLARLTR